MVRLKLLFAIFVITILYGCGTTREISIKSTPELADVYIREVGSQQSEKIGQTPIILTEEILKKVSTPGKAPMMIVVKRAGFLKQQLLLNDLGNTSIQYDIRLEENNLSNMMTTIDKVGSELFEAQRLIRSGSYDNSLKLLNTLNKKFPYSSIINELRGAVYYLKKDYPNALVYYDIAVKYNQKNVDAFKMKKYLEKELGIKRPLAKKVVLK
jgi:tetratricopeptide (TPR) repeat protein